MFQNLKKLFLILAISLSLAVFPLGTSAKGKGGFKPPPKPPKITKTFNKAAAKKPSTKKGGSPTPTPRPTKSWFRPINPQ